MPGGGGGGGGAKCIPLVNYKEQNYHLILDCKNQFCRTTDIFMR